MRLGWAKTKYSISYYVKKTIYVDGKNKDMVVKRLGSEKYICETYGVTDAKEWAKEQVRLMNEAEKEDAAKFNIELVQTFLWMNKGDLTAGICSFRTFITNSVCIRSVVQLQAGIFSSMT